MTILPVSVHPRASGVRVDDNELEVELVDGRRIVVPLAWFPRLLGAKKVERDRWEILGDGEGIHWPDVDEDISVAGLLRGQASVEVKRPTIDDRRG